MQNVKLNLIPGAVMPVVNVSQYDKARQFSLTVYEGSATYSLTGKDVQIRGTKPDGNGFAYDATDGVVSVSGSTVTISTTQQMTAVGGQTMAELRITQSGVILGTLNFVLMVEPSALSDDTPISDTDIPAIERLAEAQVEQAEAWAKGTKSGVPVSSDEPQYHDNAYYWSQMAQQYAQGGLRFMGSVAFASIPTTGMTNGDMYNITDDFTTDVRFIEGAGVSVKAGTNIAWLESVSKWDILAVSGGTDSLSGLQDVTLTTPTSGQFLKYDGSKWVNGNGGGGGASALDDLTDVDITTSADGDLLQYNATSQKWENSDTIPDELTAMQEAGAVNLLLNDATSQVIDNITFTINADKSITLSGSGLQTARAANTVLTLTTALNLKKGDYKMSLFNTYDATNFNMRVNKVGYIDRYYSWGENFTAGNDISGITVTFIVSKDYVLSSGTVTVYPMIYDARLLNPTYQPFTMTNRELTDAVIPETVNLTINTSNFSAGTARYVKIGKLVQIEVFGLVPVSTGMDKNISQDAVPKCVGNAGAVTIGNNGLPNGYVCINNNNTKIKIHVSSSDYMYGSFTYITE